MQRTHFLTFLRETCWRSLFPVRPNDKLWRGFLAAGVVCASVLFYLAADDVFVKQNAGVCTAHCFRHTTICEAAVIACRLPGQSSYSLVGEEVHVSVNEPKSNVNNGINEPIVRKQAFLCAEV
jgi:hypothetical protein